MDKRSQFIESAIDAFDKKRYEFEIFQEGIANYFQKNPDVSIYVHSVRSRLKDLNHLREKIQRKWDDENPIMGDNVFSRITDLAGIRVVHLFQDQFQFIHRAITSKIDSKDWFLQEQPIAYTWDPESEKYFREFGFKIHMKESFYTSIHYLIRPRSDSFICCEIQVRTLFEEIWGEVDHLLNYPQTTGNLACKEQILVLAKLVGAGSRLVDSIFRTHKQEK